MTITVNTDGRDLTGLIESCTDQLRAIDAQIDFHASKVIELTARRKEAEGQLLTARVEIERRAARNTAAADRAIQASQASAAPVKPVLRTIYADGTVRDDSAPKVEMSNPGQSAPAVPKADPKPETAKPKVKLDEASKIARKAAAMGLVSKPVAAPVKPEPTAEAPVIAQEEPTTVVDAEPAQTAEPAKRKHEGLSEPVKRCRCIDCRKGRDDIKRATMKQGTGRKRTGALPRRVGALTGELKPVVHASGSSLIIPAGIETPKPELGATATQTAPFAAPEVFVNTLRDGRKVTTTVYADGHSTVDIDAVAPARLGQPGVKLAS